MSLCQQALISTAYPPHMYASVGFNRTRDSAVFVEFWETLSNLDTVILDYWQMKFNEKLND